MTTNPSASNASRDLDKVLAVAAHNLKVRAGELPGPLMEWSEHGTTRRQNQ